MRAFPAALCSETHEWSSPTALRPGLYSSTRTLAPISPQPRILVPDGTKSKLQPMFPTLGTGPALAVMSLIQPAGQASSVASFALCLLLPPAFQGLPSTSLIHFSFTDIYHAICSVTVAQAMRAVVHLGSRGAEGAVRTQRGPTWCVWSGQTFVRKWHVSLSPSNG